MDKVGSEGDEARAMMREIRTLSLQPVGSAMSTGIRTGDGISSTTGSKFRSQSQLQQSSGNGNGSGSGGGAYRSIVPSSINGSPYRDSSMSRSIFEEKDSVNESKSNYLDMERSLDDSQYDARRIEGDLSMSIGSSVEEDVDLGPRHSNYRTP